MYSKKLESKINQMFAEIRIKVADIIASETSLKVACSEISKSVACETAARSETMLSDLCSELCTQVIDSLPDASMRNQFRYADLEQEISKKYIFSVPGEGIDFKEANRVFTSSVAGAGPAIVGGLLVYALSPAASALPIAIVVAASVSAFCVSYLKVTPSVNKSNFKAAVNKYLMEIKASYIAWFEEVERYFNKRADEIRRSF